MGSFRSRENLLDCHWLISEGSVNEWIVRVCGWLHVKLWYCCPGYSCFLLDELSDEYFMEDRLGSSVDWGPEPVFYHHACVSNEFYPCVYLCVVCLVF